MVYRSNNSLFGLAKDFGQGSLVGLPIRIAQWVQSTFLTSLPRLLVSSMPRPAQQVVKAILPPILHAEITSGSDDGDASMEQIEDALLSTLTCPTKHDWRHFTTKAGHWSMHSIELIREPETGETLSPPDEMTTSTSSSDELVPLVFLHGALTGALCWLPIMEMLSTEYNHIVFLDFPGNGRSPVPDALHEATDPETIVSLYMEALEGWRASRGFTQMILVGHSFGGFLWSLYAQRFPQYVQRLVLIAPAGQLPVAGPSTWLHAFVFSLTPQFILRSLHSRVGQWIFNHLLWKSLGLNLGIELREYYYRINTSRFGIADISISRMTDFPSSTEVMWSYPAFGFLMDVKAPVTLIWGENDNLIDCGLGYFMHRVMRDVDLFIVSKGSHNPAHSSPAKFCRILASVIRSPPLPRSAASSELVGLGIGSRMYSVQRHMVSQRWLGTISRRRTVKRKAKLYQYIADLYVSSGTEEELDGEDTSRQPMGKIYVV